MSADDVLLRADRLPRVCLGDATPGTATKCSHLQTHKHKSQHPTKGEKTNLWQTQVGTATHIPRVQRMSDSAQMKKTASLPVADLSTGVCVHNYLHVSIRAFADGLHKNQKMHLGRSGWFISAIFSLFMEKTNLQFLQVVYNSGDTKAAELGPFI